MRGPKSLAVSAWRRALLSVRLTQITQHVNRSIDCVGSLRPAKPTSSANRHPPCRSPRARFSPFPTGRRGRAIRNWVDRGGWGGVVERSRPFDTADERVTRPASYSTSKLLRHRGFHLEFGTENSDQKLAGPLDEIRVGKRNALPHRERNRHRMGLAEVAGAREHPL